MKKKALNYSNCDRTLQFQELWLVFMVPFLFRPISAKIENSTSNILDFIFIFQIWNQMICEKKKTKKKKKAQIQVERTKNLFLIAGSLYVVGHLNIPSSFFFFVSPSPPHFSIVLLQLLANFSFAIFVFSTSFCTDFQGVFGRMNFREDGKKGGETF